METMRRILNRIPRFPREYLNDIEHAYERCQSVHNITSWLKKLDSLSLSLQKGNGTYRQVENLLFEIKVINYVNNINPKCNIEYEPRGMDKQGKTCDLLIKTKYSYLVELKSFHPKHKATPIPYSHITERNEVIMDEHCYHDIQAVRGHLIDEAFDTENKIENYIRENQINVLGLLLGYYLHIEDLRDFVTIYRKGMYRYDDPLGKMTIHNMKKEFNGNIHEFWGFPFNQIDFDLMDGKEAVSVSLIQGKDVPLKLYQLTSK